MWSFNAKVFACRCILRRGIQRPPKAMSRQRKPQICALFPCLASKACSETRDILRRRMGNRVVGMGRRVGLMAGPEHDCSKPSAFTESSC